jgi:hypothetical protein
MNEMVDKVVASPPGLSTDSTVLVPSSWNSRPALDVRIVLSREAGVV